MASNLAQDSTLEVWWEVGVSASYTDKLLPTKRFYKQKHTEGKDERQFALLCLITQLQSNCILRHRNTLGLIERGQLV